MMICAYGTPYRSHDKRRFALVVCVATEYALCICAMSMLPYTICANDLRNWTVTLAYIQSS